MASIDKTSPLRSAWTRTFLHLLFSGSDMRDTDATTIYWNVFFVCAVSMEYVMRFFGPLNICVVKLSADGALCAAVYWFITRLSGGRPNPGPAML